MFQCTVCFKSFTLNKNLYQHMRKKHRIEPTIRGAKLLCPLLCVDRFRTRKELRTHLELFHGQIIEKEELDFPDYEAFEIWKKRLESTSGYCHTCRISEKLLSRGKAKSHFYCHRSGIYRSGSTGQRRIKKIGSNKIGSTCPSAMEVTRSISDGKVHVLFWKTHVGHDKDISRTPVPKSSRPKNSDSITYDVYVVLPAAGIGERMGLDIPKQYISIHGKPIICYTVDAFLRMPFIKKVIVVASSENLELMVKTLSTCASEDGKLMVTEGCGTRHRSISSGLKAIQICCDTHPEVVVIHDGVRPFVSEKIVCNVVLAAKEYGAAGVICPLVSTVLSVDENNLLATSPDRSKYKASEMPQAFQFDIINKAYAECSAHDLDHGTECLQLVQKYCNINAKLLPGSTDLWKVTHHKDIYAAAACVKESQAVAILTTESSDLVSSLQASLSKKFKFVHVTEKLNDKYKLCKFQNVVHLWNQKSISDIIDELTELYSNHTSTSFVSSVHIVLDSFNLNENFFEVQSFSRSVATTLKSIQLLFYFILPQKLDFSESYEEMSELTTSLLFDSNPNISGSIFVI